jgi:hypothetical protein
MRETKLEEGGGSGLLDHRIFVREGPHFGTCCNPRHCGVVSRQALERSRAACVRGGLILLQSDTRVLWILNRKFECDVLVCQAVVNASEGIQLGLDINLVLGVKVDLQGLGAIDLVADSLAHDLSWVNNVLKDLLVNMCQGS